MPLYLNLSDCDEGEHLLEFQEDASSLEFSGADVRVKGPIELALRIRRERATVVVSGRVELSATRVCDRCLADYSHRIRAEVGEVYHIVDGARPMPGDDGEGLHYISSRASRIDVAPMLREQVLLELPMKNVCREDCLGLCPSCGVNRNLETCGCERERIDPRWERLRQLQGGDPPDE